MKKIIDVCCGSRMFWFNKRNPNVVFTDIREESHILCDGRKLEIKPDEIMDFRDIKYPSKSFKLVVFDPPHLQKLGKNSWMAKKYGVLEENWREDIARGFSECMRILDDFGVLIFKWNTRDIKIKELIAVIGQEPLFGHTTKSGGETIWMCFMRYPAPEKG